MGRERGYSLHATPRDLSDFMVRLLFEGTDSLRVAPEQQVSVYDPACGEGRLLLHAKEHLLVGVRRGVRVDLYGQDMNPDAVAACRQTLLDAGQVRDASNIRVGSTLSEDAFPQLRFPYIIANPPFGWAWAGREAVKDEGPFVRKEHAEQGFAGRFGAGLPRTSDSQMLFLQHAISRMRPASEGGSRLVILSNASPLITGEAGTGESRIRRWMLREDLVEAIVALPGGLFPETDIRTFVWVLTNAKQDGRKGKLLLVNGAATHGTAEGESFLFAERDRRRPEGKRSRMADENTAELVRLVGDFRDGPYTRVVEMEEFTYQRLTIEHSLRMTFQVLPVRTEALRRSGVFERLVTVEQEGRSKPSKGVRKQEAVLDVLGRMDSGIIYRSRAALEQALRDAFSAASVRVGDRLMRAITMQMGEPDDAGETCLGSDGKPEADPNQREYERIGMHDDPEEYLRSEVLPHAPEAWLGEVADGCEIDFRRFFAPDSHPRPLDRIEEEIRNLEREVHRMLLGEVAQ